MEIILQAASSIVTIFTLLLPSKPTRYLRQNFITLIINKKRDTSYDILEQKVLDVVTGISVFFITNIGEHIMMLRIIMVLIIFVIYLILKLKNHLFMSVQLKIIMVIIKLIGMFNLVKVLKMNLVNGQSVIQEWNCLFKGNR